MVFLKKIFGLFVLLLASAIAFAQPDQDLNKQNIIEQRIEVIVSTLDETVELDYTNLFEDLSYYYEHPINLNRAKYERAVIFSPSHLTTNNVGSALRL